MVLNVHRNHKAYKGRGEEGGAGGGGGGGGMAVGEEVDYIPIAIHCHNHNDFCIKVGSDESHFNIS